MMARHMPLLLLLAMIGACSDAPPSPLVSPKADTTSHELLWNVDVVGDAQTSLQQFFVVNDSVVYVVGEIAMRDSTGKLEKYPYNAARWNGKSWQPIRIPILLCGTSHTYPAGLSAGFGFQESKLKFFTNNLTELTDSGYRTHCDLAFILRGSTRNVFAYSDDDYYLIGGNSSITHWDGRAFMPEETGTSWETNDLYGNAYDLWAVAGTPSAYKGGVLYKPRGGNWSPVDSLSDGYKRSVNSVWCDSRPYDRDGFVALAGAGDMVSGHDLAATTQYNAARRSRSRQAVFLCGAGKRAQRRIRGR